MASSVSQADLKRDKFHLVLVFVLALISFVIVFKPIRLAQSGRFVDVAFTYGYEQPFPASEQYREQIRSDLKKKLVEDFPDARISYPTTNELRVRVPMENRKEKEGASGKLKDILLQVVPKQQGKQTSESIDDSAFGDPPLLAIGRLGLYRPKLALRLGLDLQGGVQLVLKARTQNTQYEFRLADTGADLKAALAAGTKPAVVDTKAAPADAKAAPADAKATPADAKTTPAEAKAAPADAKKAVPAESGKKVEAPKTQTGKTAPDGGEPLRLAQAPKGATPAPPDAKDAKSAPADAKDAKSAPVVPADADDASLLSDDALRRGVAERIRLWMDEEQSKFPAAWGEVHAEMIGSNVVVLRTYIKPNVGGADKKELLGSQKAAFENALKKVFPKVVALGEPRELKIPANAIQQVKDVIQRRVDKLGVAEAQCVTQGTDRVAVQLPGIKDPEEAVQMLGTTARLEFRKVPEKYVPKVDKSEGGKETTNFSLKTDGSPVPTEVAYYEAPEFDGDKNILVGTHLKSNAVNVSFTKGTEPAVNLTLTSEGAKRFDKFARDNLNKYLAVYLDGEVISAPQMHATQFNGQVQISGGFQTLEEANALKILLNAGSLPVPVDVVEQRTVSATLGADSIKQAGRAGLLGTLLIVIIMASLFRISGWLANVALAFYCIYTLAALQLVGATLTMPGILGLLLSVGMAVDANVIVFERLKEEVREYHSRPLAANLRHAYDRSWPAILDGNVTAMMMAIVLYALGTGSIRGFAVTLALGIFCHLFTALVVTRKLQTLLAASHLAEHIDKAYRV